MVFVLGKNYIKATFVPAALRVNVPCQIKSLLLAYVCVCMCVCVCVREKERERERERACVCVSRKLYNLWEDAFPLVLEKSLFKGLKLRKS